MISTPSPEKPEKYTDDSPLQSKEREELKIYDDEDAASRSATPDTNKVVSDTTVDPPVPAGEAAPPLPNEAPPGQPLDDGWEPVWDDSAQAFYFHNRLTHATQWDNPRVPQTLQPTGPPGVENYNTQMTRLQPPPSRKAGGYDPAIHGDFDPNADYAKAYQISSAADGSTEAAPGTDPADAYAATGTFNRFTGKWQRAELNPENFTDEQKSKRQMNAFFDVDAAANSHNGKSLRAERQNQKLSKAELKAFKEKRRDKKEEKRRAWLRD